MNRTALYVLATVLLTPALAFAHPGHGASEGHSLLHYLTEPLHAYGLFGVPLAGLAAGALWRWRRSRG